MVELLPVTLDRLDGRSLLGDLGHDLTGDEITSGLNRLEAELLQCAPLLRNFLNHFLISQRLAE